LGEIGWTISVNDKEPRAKRDRPAGSAPTEARLQEAALAHLAKFAATEAGLAQVLTRRVNRWARRAEAEGQDHDQVVAAAGAARLAAQQVARKLASSGVVDDAAFAASRARRLARGGRSRRAIAAHLSAKGVAGEVAQAVLPDDELGAALMLCRRRRFGPFAREAVTPEVRLKSLAALARAGFSRDAATAALDMATEQAEDRVRALRDG
jgi:regulatory protein